MVVTWVSPSRFDALRYSTTAGGPYTFGTTPELSTYSLAPNPNQNTSYTSQIIHRVYLTGLTASTRIYYLVGNNETGWSVEASFLTHPGVGPNVPVNMLVLADMDQISSAQSVMASIVQPDVLSSITGGAIFCGDLAYANGAGPVWDTWQDFFEPLSSTVAVMTNAGNLKQAAYHVSTPPVVLTLWSPRHIQQAANPCFAGNHEYTNEPNFIAFKTRFGGMPYASPINDDSGVRAIVSDLRWR